MLHIDLQKNGLTLNGVFMTTIDHQRFAEVLGTPRETLHKGKIQGETFIRKVWIWDELGLLINIPTKENKYPSVEFRMLANTELEQQAQYPYFDLNPKGFFTGKLSINKKEILSSLTKKEIANIYYYIEKNIGHWQCSFRLTDEMAQKIKPFALQKDKTQIILDILSSENKPYYGGYFAYEPPKPKKILSDKYKLRKANDDDLISDNFNFKLAIIEELMYNQNSLTPKFDIYEFAREYPKRDIDPNDYYDAMIPEIKKWFANLPIPKALAKQITQLHLDGGNDVFAQLIPQWDGECDIFDIKKLSEAEFSQFPNLKTINGTAFMMSKKVEKFLLEKGVTINIG